ncbi:hypothetical protein LGR54_02415 [Ancylobacter sp. Lp-2]|uniref:hypothetical protein n=1 Tax=Ancylobacter sp. Lp-2 TaxID=2881339 RepID=UPI001E4BDB07|nr:hypothetical protein [Ancylobacter sp. Lp-2]MCB4767447.1 hypothetical protein [Ancylobacter sp. Lp-2]
MREGVFGISGMTGSARRLIIVPALGLLLAGCAGGIGGGGNEGPMGGGNADGQGGFGSTMETTSVAPTSGSSSGPTAVGRAAPAAPALPAPVTAARGTGSTQTVVAGNGSGGANSAAGIDPDDYSCPGVQVRGGAASWQVTDGAEGGIRYQANLGAFSRECHFARPDMNMRVGIQGRVLLGAKGTPGKVTVPLRLAVVEEGPTPKPVWTKLYTVPVEIGQGVAQVDFGLVADDVTFPLPTPAALERYVVYVGFDSQAGAAEARRTTRPRPAAQARPAQQPAQPRPAQASPAATPAAATAAPVRSTPAPAAASSSSPMIGTPQTSTAPAAASSSSASSSNSGTQWIGAPAPSTGGFSQ